LRRQSVTEATLIIIVITFLSKIVGYAREVLVANYFGATAQTDAFLIAMLVPAMILGLIAGGLQVVIIPIYTERKKKDPAQARIFVNQVFFTTVLFMGVLSIVMLIFPAFFIKAVAYGFKGERLSLAVYFMRFLIIFGFFNVLVGFLMGLYHAEKQFLYPAMLSLIGNSLIPISLIVLTPLMGINSWTVGQLALSSFFFFGLFLMLFLKKSFFRAFQLNNVDWPAMRHFGALLLPIIAASGIGTINAIVDKTIASSLVVGSIAILNFAQRVYLIPLTLFAVPLAIAVYPTFSSLATEKNYKGYAETFKQSMSFMIYLMIPISVIFITLSHPIVRILFQHGAFTGSDTTVTAFVVSMYSLGLFAMAARRLFARSFFAFQDTKTPLYLSIIIVAINIIGNLTLSRILGAGGIALATAIAATTGLFLYAYTLRKKQYIKGLRYMPLLKEGIKIIIVSLFIGGLSILLKPYINASPNFITSVVRFVLVLILLTAVYIPLTWLFKSYGYSIFKSRFKNFISRLKNK
jgi:putative peptidoglycan lipid II flippase